MHYIDPYMVERLMAMRLDEVRGQVRPHSLLRQVVPTGEGSLSQQRCRLLHHVGHQLVALGEWLERYGSPQPSYY